MKQLIIAEKPSLARSVMSALEEEGFVNSGGYYTGNRYLVSYAYGHLFSLLPLEGYLPAEEARKGWKIETLPFFPGYGRAEDYQFELIRSKSGKGKGADAGAKKQFAILKKLMNRKDVNGIIHCGDADREGEVIIRLILKEGLSSKKPIYRLWLPDQTKETIREQLRKMEKDECYDNLYNEGLCRTIMDWMYGINLSRYASLSNRDGEVCAVGRVLTPIVQAVNERDEKIRAFISVPYLKVEADLKKDGISFKLSIPEKFSIDERRKAHLLCRDLNESPAVVVDAECKDIIRRRPKLFSLSALQSVLAGKYKMPMEKSLAAVQALYEKGLVTYPRTNTQYLSENEKDKAARVIALMAAQADFNIRFRDSKEIFDDKKIESHSAIIPTGKKANDLSTDEAKVYETIRNRFFAAFAKNECIIQESLIMVFCAGHEMTLTGEALLQKGFLAFEPGSIKNELPVFFPGEKIPCVFQVREKRTSPPDHYTTKTLTDYLKKPFGRENAKMGETEENDDQAYLDMKRGVALGTEATRTAIITKAIRMGYIEQKEDTYRITPKGARMLRLLKSLGMDISPETSVKMQMALKAVYNGERTVNETLAYAMDQVRKNTSGGST